MTTAVKRNIINTSKSKNSSNHRNSKNRKPVEKSGLTSKSFTSLLQKSIDKIESFIIKIQDKNGTWPEPYYGISFLIPIYIFGCWVYKIPISSKQSKKFSNTIFATRQKDGSFGLHHWATKGNLFSSVISYVALRYLGHQAKEAKLKKTLGWIHAHGGPLYANNWTKFILSFLNLYSYDGVAPVPPELYLFPSWFPFHPRKIAGWVRIIYLPMSYLYRTRSQIPVDDFIITMRKELYRQDFDSVPFKKHLFTIAETDALKQETPILKLSTFLLKKTEWLIPGFISRKALNTVYEHILYEDEQSEYVRQAPVNAVYNTIVHYFKNNQSALKKSTDVLPDYLWETATDIYVQGHTNTFSWDNGLYLFALADESYPPKMAKTVEKARKFMLENQLVAELPNPDKFFRIQRVGAWPFSSQSCGWGIPDCTANGIKGLLTTENHLKKKVSDKVIQQGIEFLFRIQNPDGGWGSIDVAIGSPKLEWFNAANNFFDIMADCSYLECTGSVLQAFMKVKQYRPHLYTEKVDRAVKRGVWYLLKSQEKNGSWYAFWGLCYIYGTCFVVEGLKLYGLKNNDPVIKRACQFILDTQHQDGSWGESPETWIQKSYIPSNEGICVSTAMAIMVLINGGHAEHPAVKRGVEWLISKQLKNGDWPEQVSVGGFYRSVLVQYPNYKRYFVLLALKRYRAAISN